MRGATERRILILDGESRRYRLRLLRSGNLDSGADWLLSGEALCQHLLLENPDALVLARGPLAFLSGNKTTVGFVSPLTGLPHYSFVGGRGFTELFNLGLDALVFSGGGRADEYVLVAGRAPHLSVDWKPADPLPGGQRSAYYWLVEHELGGERETGSVFTLGEGARWGYRTANLAADCIYHAGRGGAGHVFGRFAAALVLHGEPQTVQSWLGARADAFYELRDGEIRQRLARYCERLSRRNGGTIAKLFATGSGPKPTLPARNAQRLGYALADLGAAKVLRATRVGQTGCQWCQVNCRHWHWVDVDYGPAGQDMFLNDFEPAFAIFAMLDLTPDDDSLEGRLRLLDEVDRRIIVTIEQMGCDVIDAGVGLAALLEGLESGLIPLEDAPDFMRTGPYLGNLDLAAQVVAALRAGDESPALRALGDGPQALAERYPSLQARMFTCGPGTLANAGHSNALWTFLMPFSRFFGHYTGQIYKVSGELTPDLGPEQIQTLFERVVAEMLEREFLSCLGNALSMCAFTFVIFSQDGEGVGLDQGDLLIRVLAACGLETSREELEWFAEAFWARSITLKIEYGWRSPSAADFPARVYQALSQALDRSTDDLRVLMDQLIIEWQRQAGQILFKYGCDVPSEW